MNYQGDLLNGLVHKEIEGGGIQTFINHLTSLMSPFVFDKWL